jgi:hypothetical protein
MLQAVLVWITLGYLTTFSYGFRASIQLFYQANKAASSKHHSEGTFPRLWSLPFILSAKEAAVVLVPLWFSDVQKPPFPGLELKFFDMLTFLNIFLGTESKHCIFDANRFICCSDISEHSCTHAHNFSFMYKINIQSGPKVAWHW